MADEREEGQERTESPTPRRREEARREGRVARSTELSAATVLLAGGALLAAVGGRSIAAFLFRQMNASARALAAGPLTAAGATALVRDTGTGLVGALVPFAVGVTGLVTAVNLAQARGVVSLKPITPKLSNISPLTGLKRLFSVEALFNLLKSIVKLLVLALVSYQVIRHAWPELASLSQAGPQEIASVMLGLAVRLAITVGLAFLVVAGADYAFQVHRLEKSLKMTRQEVVQDARDSEGDPLVKAHILSLARARARRRMLQKVPTADVVITNPTHVAVALRYDVVAAPAPIVVAMGERKLAERIKAIARKAGVPVVENRPVARALLATAKVGQMIPPALYAAVAEILAWVYRQRAALPEALRHRAARGER